MSPTKIQGEPLVLEDIEQYAGAWVAIRDGHVVASALDPIELRDNPEVREDDALMPVPSAGAHALVL